MCRRNQLWGWILTAFGAGLLVGQMIESGFFCTCLGILCILGGVCFWQPKCRS